jgi:hypothetical protein
MRNESSKDGKNKSVSRARLRLTLALLVTVLILAACRTGSPTLDAAIAVFFPYF